MIDNTSVTDKVPQEHMSVLEALHYFRGDEAGKSKIDPKQLRAFGLGNEPAPHRRNGWG